MLVVMARDGDSLVFTIPFAGKRRRSSSSSWCAVLTVLIAGGDYLPGRRRFCCRRRFRRAVNLFLTCVDVVVTGVVVIRYRYKTARCVVSALVVFAVASRVIRRADLRYWFVEPAAVVVVVVEMVGGILSLIALVVEEFRLVVGFVAILVAAQ